MKKFLLILLGFYTAFIFGASEAKEECIFNADCSKGEYCDKGKCKQEKDIKLKHQTNPTNPTSCRPTLPIEYGDNSGLVCSRAPCPDDPDTELHQECKSRFIPNQWPTCSCEPIPPPPPPSNPACNSATAPQCAGSCNAGETCTPTTNNEFCLCKCGNNRRCNSCQVCNNGNCQKRANNLECGVDNDCINNPNGHHCFFVEDQNEELRYNHCQCGCRSSTECPSGKVCDYNDNICKVIPPGGCINGEQCQYPCEVCDTKTNLCVLLRPVFTCSQSKPCKSSECKDCKCACSETFPNCNGWAPDGKVCQPNADNTGCVLVDYTCGPGNNLTSPACDGNCPVYQSCISNSRERSCHCESIGVIENCETRSPPLCGGTCHLEGQDEDEYPTGICKSYTDLILGSITYGQTSCKCLNPCTSDSDCQPNLFLSEKTEQCINGYCVSFPPCGTTHPSNGCSGMCPRGQQCVPNDTETVCECQGGPCEKTSPLECSGGVCDVGKACRSSTNPVNGRPSCDCFYTCTETWQCSLREWYKWCNNGICVPRQSCNTVTNLSCEGGLCPEGQYCGASEGPNPCQCTPLPVCREAPSLRCEVGTCPRGQRCALSEPNENGELSCSCTD